MIYVLCSEDEVPDWIYPDKKTKFSGKYVELPEMSHEDFTNLWLSIDPALDNDTKALECRDSNCEVGYPHDAPEYVERINPKLVKALAEIKDNERWLIAKQWATVNLQHRPNEEKNKLYKDMLKSLCIVAKESVNTKCEIFLIQKQFC